MNNKIKKGNKYGIISLVGFAVNLVTCLLALAYILCINPPTDSLVGVIPLIIAFFIIAGSALTSIITSFIGFALTRSKITVIAILASIVEFLFFIRICVSI